MGGYFLCGQNTLAAVSRDFSSVWAKTLNCPERSERQFWGSRIEQPAPFTKIDTVIYENVVCMLCCICVSGFRYDRRQDDQLGQNSRQHRHAFLSCSFFLFILSSPCPHMLIKQESLPQKCLSSMTHLYPEFSPGRH